LAQFRKVRSEQLALLPQFKDSRWKETREAVWGPMALRWVVSKTYQHTAEHTNDVMQMALFWDRFEARRNANGA
jgi:hypothetical protein